MTITATRLHTKKRRHHRHHARHDHQHEPTAPTAGVSTTVVVQCIVIIAFCVYFSVNAMLTASSVIPTSGDDSSYGSSGSKRKSWAEMRKERRDKALKRGNRFGGKAVSPGDIMYKDGVDDNSNAALPPMEKVKQVSETENPLILHAAKNRVDDGDNTKKPIVAILVAVRSDPEWDSMSAACIQRFVVESLQRHVSESEIKAYDIRLYVAMDDDDKFFLNYRKNWLDLKIPPFLSVHVHTFPNKDHRIPFNEIAAAAQNDGADYFARINDDSEFTSKFIDVAISALQKMDPPNVGVVGPSCKEGNEKILTHDFVHKTHLEIFGYYYPPQFHNWYLDDWISNVYAKKVLGEDFVRMQKLATWTVTHHLKKPRYFSNEADKKFLPVLYDQGLEKVRAYLKEHYPDFVTKLKEKEDFSNHRPSDCLPESKTMFSHSQITAILDVLPKENGNLLSWGLDNNAPYWHKVTDAAFVENPFASTAMAAQWVEFMKDAYPDLDAHKLTFKEGSWDRYHDHPERWKELEIHDFPSTLLNREWDVIIIDSPSSKNPGRYQSIWMTHYLIQQILKKNPKKTIHVFLDDYNLFAEHDFSQEVFERKPVSTISRHAEFEQAHYVFGADAPASSKKPKEAVAKEAAPEQQSWLNHWFGAGSSQKLADPAAAQQNVDVPKPAEKTPSRLGGGGLISAAIGSKLRKEEPSTTKSWTIVVTVNDGYYDFMLNWLLHFDKLGITNQVIAVAEDDKAYAKLQALGLPPSVVEVQKSPAVEDIPNALEYDTQDFISMVSTRPTQLLKHVRDAGKDVIYTDVDTVWRFNPMRFLDKPSNSDNDVMMLIDQDSYSSFEPYYCPGVIAIRSNPHSIAFLEQWETATKEKPQLQQPLINEILHKSQAKHSGLPKAEFPSGQAYFDQFTDEQRVETVLVHNNYVSGHDVKRERFRKHDLWHVELV